MGLLRRVLGGAADSTALAYFRIVFGVVMVWEAGRYLTTDWIARHYVAPGFHFTYWPFDMVRPWPEPFMTAHVWVIGIAAALLALGWFTRAAAATLWVSFTYLLLLDQARYLNHYYLISLLAFLLVFLPSERALSVDAWWRPRRASDTVPAWTLGLLRFQIAVPYVFGGIGKINDDWLAGQPMRDWLAADTDFPVVGRFFLEESVVQAFVWGGLLGDLLVVPCLLFRRTRLLGLAWMIAFHLINSRLFEIGVFPWLMILATLVFLPSDWLRQLGDDVRRNRTGPLLTMLAFAVVGFVYGNLVPSQPSSMNALIGAAGMAVLGWELARYGWDAVPRRGDPAHRPIRPALAWAMVWVVVQVLIPLRHYAIPGNVHWTEEGHRWSWHMKLRDKDLDRLVITRWQPGRAPEIVTAEHDGLAEHQWRKLGKHPDMLVQYAHHLRAQAESPDTVVTVQSWVSLNGREPRLLVDPSVDLSRVPRPWPFPGAFIRALDAPPLPDPPAEAEDPTPAAGRWTP